MSWPDQTAFGAGRFWGDEGGDLSDADAAPGDSPGCGRCGGWAWGGGAGPGQGWQDWRPGTHWDGNWGSWGGQRWGWGGWAAGATGGATSSAYCGEDAPPRAPASSADRGREAEPARPLADGVRRAAPAEALGAGSPGVGSDEGGAAAAGPPPGSPAAPERPRGAAPRRLLRVDAGAARRIVRFHIDVQQQRGEHSGSSNLEEARPASADTASPGRLEADVPEPAGWKCNSHACCDGAASDLWNDAAEAGQLRNLDTDSDEGSDSTTPPDDHGELDIRDEVEQDARDAAEAGTPEGTEVSTRTCELWSKDRDSTHKPLIPDASLQVESLETALEVSRDLSNHTLTVQKNPWAGYRSSQAGPARESRSHRRRHPRPHVGSWHASGSEATASASSSSKSRARLSRDLATKWSTRDILETATQGVTQFDLVTAVTAVHRIAKSADVREARADKRLSGILAVLVDKVVDVVTDGSACIEAKEVTKTLWALAKIGMGNSPLMDSLAEQAIRKIRDLDGHGLSNIVWAFATLRVWNGPLLAAIAAEALRRLADFEPQGLANTAWALAKLPSCDRPLMASLAEEVLRSLCDFAPQGLANIAWAFATLGLRNHTLMDAIAAESIASIRVWSYQNLANIAWAFAKLNLEHLQLMEAIASAAIRTIHEWNSLNIASMVWAFARLLVVHGQLCDSIASESLQKLWDFSAQNLVNIAWSFAKLV